VRAGHDIELDAARDLKQRARRSVEVAAGREGAPPQLRVDPEETAVTAARLSAKAVDVEVAVERATVIARHLATTAESVVYNVERIELSATQLIERARDTFREVTDLAETHAGRVRTLVSDVYALYSKRTAMSSTEETSVAADKIFLG